MVPSPGCSGILGRAFLDCFAATELRFSAPPPPPSQPSDGGSAPSIITETPFVDEIRFYQSKETLLGGPSAERTAAGGGAGDRDESVCHEPVKMHTLGVTGLWGVHIRASRSGVGSGDGSFAAINDSEAIEGLGGGDGPSVSFTALVDTGAPVTVLNVAAAAALGLVPREPATQSKPASTDKPEGLLSQWLSKLGARSTPSLVGAVGGLTLSPCSLVIVIEREANGAARATFEANRFEGEGPVLCLGMVRPMIGDLAGFASLGMEPGRPAAILGLDALRAGGRVSVAFIPEDNLLILSDRLS